MPAPEPETAEIIDFTSKQEEENDRLKKELDRLMAELAEVTEKAAGALDFEHIKAKQLKAKLDDSTAQCAELMAQLKATEEKFKTFAEASAVQLKQKNEELEKVTEQSSTEITEHKHEIAKLQGDILELGEQHEVQTAQIKDKYDAKLKKMRQEIDALPPAPSIDPSSPVASPAPPARTASRVALETNFHENVVYTAKLEQQAEENLQNTKKLDEVTGMLAAVSQAHTEKLNEVNGMLAAVSQALLDGAAKMGGLAFVEQRA
jgi:hypothetical protein